ncbi:MAG: hypothetical protein Q7T80_01575 [Methanoregula sp.]|nr:hypothetical protein [Methanoregula sp.]
MRDLYVLASIPDQGKTTTAIALEKKLRSEGKRVACLQLNKGKYDVHRYLSEGCFHYTIPLEATKGKEVFEQWVPEGYDAYIMEITFGYSPIGAAYITLFNHVNEVISFESRNDWKNIVDRYLKNNWEKHYQEKSPFPMSLWDLVHDRNIQRVITKTPNVIDGPCVDTQKILYHENELAVEPINPGMKLPKGNKKVLAVGVFPAEYWDIFPSLQWFRFDYAGFMDDLRKKQYDLAIVGVCGTDALKLRDPPEHGTIICYQPSVYLDLQRYKSSKPLNSDFQIIYDTIKKQKPGTSLVENDTPLSAYNNRFWVYRWYTNPEILWKTGNTIFCNGWILPQYLIREGLLEVN